MVRKLFRKTLFRLRWHTLLDLRSQLRRIGWRCIGMKIGANTRLARLYVTWPHRISIGHHCTLEHEVYLKVAGGYSEKTSIVIGNGCFIGAGCEFNALSRIELGPGCLVASGTRFIDHDHGTDPDLPMKDQPERSADILLGPDVWVGVNCVILKGVTIGRGAIIAAGSVVTKNVPSGAIVAGTAGRILRLRTERTGQHAP